MGFIPWFPLGAGKVDPLPGGVTPASGQPRQKIEDGPCAKGENQCIMPARSELTQGIPHQLVEEGCTSGDLIRPVVRSAG